MGKSYRRFTKRRGFLRKTKLTHLPFHSNLALISLVNNTVIKADLFGTQFAEDFWILSVTGVWTIEDNTATEGPIYVGLTHNDLTIGEVLECLDSELVDPSDIIQRERSRRPVRTVGAFPGLATHESLNHGDKVRAPVKFLINDGHMLAMYAVNRSGANLTGSAVVVLDGIITGRWIT